MDFARKAVTRIIAGILAPFAGHDPLLSLVPLSILIALLMLWVFRATSNPEAIRAAKTRLQAHLYEMRLFVDEPALIWRAQAGLLAANFRYMGWMLGPALVMSVPLFLIFSQLQCFYAYAPLQSGRDAIVTVQLKPGQREVPILRAPAGIDVETPVVRVDGGQQLSWRIRAVREAAGPLQFVFVNQTVEKNVSVGRAPGYVSERRVSSASDLLWYPGEARLPSGPIDWIDINYPAAPVRRSE